MSGQVKLPVRLDTAAARALDAALEGDDTLEVDASDVEMIGGLCLEVMIGAIGRRQAAGAGVEINSPSDGFADSLAALGVDLERLQSGGYCP